MNCEQFSGNEQLQPLIEIYGDLLNVKYHEPVELYVSNCINAQIDVPVENEWK